MPSVRLFQVLTTYCHDLNRSGPADLDAALRSGRYPWFAEEFAAAITTGGLTPQIWASITGTALRTGESPEAALHRELRRVWGALFEQDYPGDGVPDGADAQSSRDHQA